MKPVLTLASILAISIVTTGCGALVELSKDDGDKNTATGTNNTNSTSFPALKGTLDPAFGGGDGIADDNAMAGLIASWGGMFIAPNGTVAVAGMGSMDLSASGYDASGTALPALTDINQACGALFVSQCFVSSGLTQADGKFVVGVKPLSSPVLKVLRFNIDGTPDTSFGTSGIATINGWTVNTESFKILQRKNGKLLFLIEIQSAAPGGFSPAIVQLNTDGSVDTGFATAGLATITKLWNAYDMDINLESDDVYLAGKNANLPSPNQVVKVTSAGVEDSAFAGTGLLDLGNSDNERPKIAFDKLHQKVVVASGMDGSAGTVTRINLDGTIDSTFGTAGVVTLTYNSGVPMTGMYFGRAIRFEHDSGKLLVLGEVFPNGGMGGNPVVDSKLARLNEDGSLDTSFGSAGVFSKSGPQKLYSMDFAPDGKLYVGGTTTTYTGFCMIPMPGMGFPNDCMPGMYMNMPTANYATIYKVE